MYEIKQKFDEAKLTIITDEEGDLCEGELQLEICMQLDTGEFCSAAVFLNSNQRLQLIEILKGK